MKMFTDRVDQDLVHTVQQGLARAAAKIHAAQLRAAASRGLARAAWVIAGTAGGVAVVVAVERFTSAASVMTLRIIIAWFAAAGLLAWALVVVAAIGVARRRKLNLSHVAERLDLAAVDHNAIATALELALSGERSPFAEKAIAVGIEALRLAGDTQPIDLPEPVADRRGWAAAAIGSATMALAFLVPSHRLNQFVARDSRNAMSAALVSESLPGDAQHTPQVIPPRTPMIVPGSAGPVSPSQASAAASNSHAAQSSLGQASESTGSSSDNSALTAAAASNAPPSDPATHPPTPAQPAQAPQPAGPMDNAQGQRMQLSAARRAAAEEALSKASPRGGSDGQTDQGADLSRDPQRGSSGSGSPSHAKLSKDSTKSDPNASGTAADAAPNATGHPSSGSLSTGLEVGGHGQSGGQNPPKKSRGVAPLLLGTPEPDLFEGPQLAGPDERTRLQIAPQPLPADPAPAAAVAARRDNEPPVPAYRVPAESRHMVDDYFERFHEDADPHPIVPTN
jgi:hypothetical protein